MSTPNYQWAPDAEIVIKGKQFEIMYKNLQVYLQQPQSQEVIAMMQMMEMMSEAFNEAVKSGVIKEAPVEEAKPSAPPPKIIMAPAETL